MARLHVWALLATLSVLTGCQSCGNGGFLSRLCSRRGSVVCEGAVMGMPMHGMPISNGACCEGGPYLADPGMMMGSGPMMPPGNGMYTMPPMTAPPMTTPPNGTLPAPFTGPPPLAPVPGSPGPGLATPTPAQPSSRIR